MAPAAPSAAPPTPPPQSEPAEAAAPEDRMLPPEIGGPQGPEPTRYGDWEKAGRCSDF